AGIRDRNVTGVQTCALPIFPKNRVQDFGISDHVYHLMAVTIGLAAAVACVGGLLILLYPRRTHHRVFGATTAGDKLMYLMLALTILSGVLATVVRTVCGTCGCRGGVSTRCRQFWTLQLSDELMSQAPICFELHVRSAIAVFGIWPFARLGHVLAAPVGYLTRPYIVYRSKGPR